MGEPSCPSPCQDLLLLAASQLGAWHGARLGAEKLISEAPPQMSQVNLWPKLTLGAGACWQTGLWQTRACL